MRVMVALENRFYKTENGQIYSSTVCDYNFWKRYLNYFDEVLVFARVGKTDKLLENKQPATGPGVSFFELPMYIGPQQYWRKRNVLRNLTRIAVQEADAFILRIPGTMGTLLWKELRRRGIPYGVEVVGSIHDSLKTSNINPVIESILYFLELTFRTQKRQCAFASAAAYVTQHYLQKMYPAGGWNTYYSSIDLTEDCFASEEQLSARKVSLEKAVSGQRLFQISHAASMDARYKAQDDLIRAVACCRRHGANVELVLIGDGKYQNYYKSMARQESIENHVRFLGRLPSGKPVRNQLDQADIFAFPSLTEGLPKVLIEAMARGLPCIASKVGGIPELIEDDFLVLPGKIESLTEKLLFMLNTPRVLSEASRRNIVKAQEYIAVELTPRRVEYYKKLAEITQEFRKNHPVK